MLQNIPLDLFQQCQTCSCNNNYNEDYQKNTTEYLNIKHILFDALKKKKKKEHFKAEKKKIAESH